MPRRTRPASGVMAVLGALALAWLGSCQDDTHGPAPAANLLTLEIGEFLLRAFAPEGIAFVSGPGGEVLGVATWSGAATLEFSVDDSPPDTVAYTLVRTTGRVPLLSTEVNVPTGVVVSFDGGVAHNPTGEATLEFANVPECSAYAIASSLHRIQGDGPLPARHVVPVHWGEVDVFVRIDPPGGWPLGTWQSAVGDGDEITMDLGVEGRLTPLVRHAVHVGGSADRLTANLYRHTRDGLKERFVGFHFRNYDEALPESVIMFAPDFAPAELECALYATTDGVPTESFGQTTRGVPTDLVEMPGELVIQAADIDHAAFTMTGPWDRFAASWYQKGDTQIQWYVEGAAPGRTFGLPQLPQDVIDRNPGLVRAHFFLHMVQVVSRPSPGVELSRAKIYPFPAGPERGVKSPPRLAPRWR